MTHEDERTRAALARLTQNERECLRRRLRHQTAKEMAIELGVSPHAVEKRLKMARAKLGVSSSLDAARLLDASERYGPTVPEPADLGPGDAADDDAPAGARPSASTGVPPVTLFLACLAAVLPQASAPLPVPVPLPPVPPGTERIQDVTFRPAAPDEVRAFVRDSFRTMDADGSGYIERDEAPDSGFYTSPTEDLGDRPASDAKLVMVKGRKGRAMWIADPDTDGDGRVSEAEFVTWDLPTFMARGVPADWRGAKPGPAVPPSGGLVDERGAPVPVRRPSWDEASAFLGEGFRSRDTDRSGVLDPAEVSAMEPRDAMRDAALPAAPAAGAPDPAAARKWMARLDTNRDGAVGRDEYVGYMIPWIMWQGIPAGWTPAR